MPICMVILLICANKMDYLQLCQFEKKRKEKHTYGMQN